MPREKQTNSSKETREKWTAEKLRIAWIEFFKKKEHLHLASASLFPASDPTLLFTTAGMVPFKDFFSGHSQPPSKRIVTIQKCIRTTDLESVGKTQRHCSFFEMLGNFSFGDYFKIEAIEYAWEFSLKVLKLNPEKIYITVYQEDLESEKIWHEKIGIPLSRIKRLGKKDNWWGPAGDQGPCGPCTELYLDRGETICKTCTCKDKENCGPGGEGDRFMEYWNLVFNQYYSDTQKQLTPLSIKGVDTGAGLERILALLNEEESIYETNEIESLLNEVSHVATNLSEKKELIEISKKNKVSLRIITDHIRSSCFSIADGIFPANTGRGYVLRRIIRRALLYVRELGIKQPLLYLLVRKVVEIYKPFYPELSNREEDIMNRLLSEENKFITTLELGLEKWQELLKKNKGNENFSGRDAFLLYDTYGFPYELTLELCEKENLILDKKSFDQAMEEQRERSVKETQWKDLALPALNLNPTLFLGYDEKNIEAKILSIIHENKIVRSCCIEKNYKKNLVEKEIPTLIKETAEILIILDQTPFYAEGGGQVGDTGKILSLKGAICEVRDTQKSGSLYIHICTLKTGLLQIGETVQASIDPLRRLHITQNHSATHLLNKALNRILGAHIVQTGSLVAENYFRFDFSHSEKISDENLKKISIEVNNAILAKGNTNIRILEIEKAKKEGAVATFGETYGSEVRVVGMGEKNSLSLELCGGCHVQNTSEIGYFHILKESSPGAGNRRIEAITGEFVKEHFQNEIQGLKNEISKHNKEIEFFKVENQKSNLKNYETLYIASFDFEKELLETFQSLNTPTTLILLDEKIKKVKRELEEKNKQKIKLQKIQVAANLLEKIESYLAQAKDLGTFKVLCIELKNHKTEELRIFCDKLKEKSKGLVILLGVTEEQKCSLFFTADTLALNEMKKKNSDLNMLSLIKKTSKHIDGNGGGRPDLAQAGGKNVLGLHQAIEEAKHIIINSCK